MSDDAAQVGELFSCGDVFSFYLDGSRVGGVKSDDSGILKADT